MKQIILVFILITFPFLGKAQNNFSITNNQNKTSVRFKLVNNLILLPVTLNGKELTFLLDTGVKKSLLFNVNASENLDLKQVKKIKLKGLGINESFDALSSKNNLLHLGKVVCPDFNLLIIVDKQFYFSARMGLDIHGIIGSEIFKDFIIEINYYKKRITFYKPETYHYKKCKKCQTFPIEFNHQKPYIKAKINTDDNKQYNLNLLIDSGSGDALWLIKNSLKNYTVPKKHFEDLLGRGLNGEIYGKKSKLKKFNIGTFKFNQLIIAQPDSSAAFYDTSFKRNGLIGSELLKRFHIIFDYQNKKITLKKNRKFFNNDFSYNKSGIELIHFGKVLVKQQNSKILFNGADRNNNVKEIITTYSYAFKNAYQISFVKKNSVAYKVGLQKNDILTKINGNEAYKYTLPQILQKLSDKAGKTIKIQVNRNGHFYDYKFKLEELL